MNENNYKKYNKPASCTSQPWLVFIAPRDRPEKVRQIRQECIDLYGHSFDECPKRLTCFSKACMGRPMPWDSPTAKEYLDKLKESQPQNFDAENNYVVQTDCNTCPLKVTCKSTCNQVADYIERSKSPEIELQYTNVKPEKRISVDLLMSSGVFGSDKEIPWDVLTERKKKIVKSYLYEQRDFRQIGVMVGFGDNRQARVKYEFYSAITQLAEVGNVRAFLIDSYEELSVRQQQIFTLVYFDGCNFRQVAEQLQVSKQSIQQTVSKVLKKYKVKWTSFVKKSGTKVSYYVPLSFKTRVF